MDESININLWSNFNYSSIVWFAPPHLQMAYIQEQQRLAREEQRKREFEIQKRKLQHISVVNPAVPNPLDDLFGKKLPSAAGSRSQGAKPSGSSTPSSNNSTPPPPPSQLPTQTFSSEPPQGLSVPTPQVATSQGQPGNAQTDIQNQKKEVQQAKPDAGMYGCVRLVLCYLATMILL